MKKFWTIFIFLIMDVCCYAQEADLRVGAEQPEAYLDLLRNKRIGLVANHTSRVHQTHLLDFLISQNISVGAVYAPEHGFRGEASAGEEIHNDRDLQTGVPIFSIYGSSQKPTKEQLENIDVLVFDIQDVGCRFYTYLSTLHYIVEACAENSIPLIVLDRPNPNGDYLAGPVLKEAYRSFVGMDPVPVVHGCTFGEMALMIEGEKWHNADRACEITVIPVQGYTHDTRYSVPVPPSPNLPNDRAIRLYPSLCFFEATSVSIGRGTPFPFQVIGYPDKRFGSFSFTPVDIPGVALNPTQEGIMCYGEDLRKVKDIPRFTLSYFLKYYHRFEKESEFLVRENWLNLLSGDDRLIRAIRKGMSEQEIAALFRSDLKQYKKIRTKYLLYPDFTSS
jgi:uncharacterized protein YbbC (DUF1343 family)